MVSESPGDGADLQSGARRRAELLSICGADAAIQRVADAMISVSRTLADSQPREGGMPFFLLDSPESYDLRVLDRVSTSGIFRKYGVALEVGCGLGGRARWLSARTGCKLIGIDPSVSLVVAAGALNRAAGMQAQVQFAAADPRRIPVASETFTHVWMLDTAADIELGAVVREGLRVLRKGGHIALQRVLRGVTEADSVVQELRSEGVVDVESRIVSLSELPRHAALARDRLRLDLRRKWPDSRVCELLWMPERSRTVMQVFGRRPV